jgi:Arp2/3 complex, 34 kD subunit p34-Arc
VTVTFEVNFEGETDQALARIFLLELNDSKRQVMNSPGVVFHDKVFPENVLSSFPGAIKTRTSSGSISFKVGES